jgi:hypothetical protein
MMETKIFKKYKALILDDTFTESSITSFRALMNGFKRTNLTDDERETLDFLFENQAPYSITPEQTKKGLNWLSAVRFTATGKERKNNPFGYREETILDSFKRFELTGLYDDYHYPYGDRHNYKPIYRVVADDEAYFDYVPFTRSDRISGEPEPLLIV